MKWLESVLAVTLAGAISAWFFHEAKLEHERSIQRRPNVCEPGDSAPVHGEGCCPSRAPERVVPRTQG